MMDITDIIEKLRGVFENGTLESKREILSRLGSNLVWNDKVLDIHCLKSIETLIEGIKSIKSEYPKFEPRNHVVVDSLNEKNEPCDPIFSTLLRG